jgi:hypothetical protein
MRGILEIPTEFDRSRADGRALIFTIRRQEMEPGCAKNVPNYTCHFIRERAVRYEPSLRQGTGRQLP